MTETMSEEQARALLVSLHGTDDGRETVHVVSVSARSRRPLNCYSVGGTSDGAGVLERIASGILENRATIADVVLYALDGAGDLVVRDLSWETCPTCGHRSHDGGRCSGECDDGSGACVCSFPDPGNFTDVGAITVRHLVWSTVAAGGLLAGWAWFLADLMARVAAFGGAL